MLLSLYFHFYERNYNGWGIKKKLGNSKQIHIFVVPQAIIVVHYL